MAPAHPTKIWKTLVSVPIYALLLFSLKKFIFANEKIIPHKTTKSKLFKEFFSSNFFHKQNFYTKITVSGQIK
jgi:hypothetical protein